MFGMGIAEVVVLFFASLFMLAVPVGIVLLVLQLVRKQGGGRLAELEAENRRLREQLDALRGAAPAPGSDLPS